MTGVKYVKIPQPVRVVNRDTGKALKRTLVGWQETEDESEQDVWSLHRFLLECIATDERVNDTYEHRRSIRRLDELLEHAEPGSVVEVDDRDLEVAQLPIKSPPPVRILQDRSGQRFEERRETVVMYRLPTEISLQFGRLEDALMNPLAERPQVLRPVKDGAA